MTKQGIFCLLLTFFSMANSYATDTIQVKFTDTITQEYECTVTGRVVKVTDGDTVEVLDADKTKHKIRLSGIDAPERKQAFGNASKKYLVDLVAAKDVCVSGSKKDRYQRLVGTVIVDGQSANFNMIHGGYAWHFKKYESEQTTLERDLFASEETLARSNTIGLWSEPDPIAPWDWRDGIKQAPKKEAATTVTPLQPTTECGAKRFCKHMNDCAEACHYLQDCGITRLDKDGDGRPCETLCSQSCGG
ncbi:thermonuclease family protein [Thiothrix lacustris]|uniref:thermonuclease family protein n=1 Tax=Thiothrix lacustris TaxID=525917 RepID=UPI0027E4310B|nr:thermonuclease family protein [Thiothrix lacustris]WMP15652.1 thermonuclease family protein [Thiothrix lacustris]